MSLAPIVSRDGRIWAADQASACAEILPDVLQPGGRLLLTVHAGTGQVTREEAYGQRVAFVAALFEEAEVRVALERAGFRVDELAERRPDDFEYQSRRIYALATRV
jgi:hypothetical protein